MKSMATLNTIVNFLGDVSPTGWAKKVQPPATSGTECRVRPILELALGAHHYRYSFPFRLLSVEPIGRIYYSKI